MNTVEAVMLLLVVVPLALASLDAAWKVHKQRKSNESEHTQR